MLETPILVKVVPLAIAGMVALTPVSQVYDMAKIQKDHTSNSTDSTTNNTHTENDRTNEQTTTIVTIREGFKGVLQDGEIFKIPFYQKTTVEKTHSGVEKENEKQKNQTDNYKNESGREVEEVPNQHVAFISNIMNGGKTVISRIWKKVRP